MIPFIRDFEVRYGVAELVAPNVRRLVAPNPGPFTFTGTGVYILGDWDPGASIAIIDPGPDMPAHLHAILSAIAGRRLTHIFVTHAHADHSPLARPLAELTGATIYAGGGPGLASDGDVRLEAGDDLEFRPDIALCGGERFVGDGWALEAIPTPGHTHSHFAYALPDPGLCFPGDCVMGWSTTVISPPDGDMGCYLQSLRRLRARGFASLWPTHGPPILDPDGFLDAYIAHRLSRERLILQALHADGWSTVRGLVEAIYVDLNRRLHPAAAHSVWAHLRFLVRKGVVETDGPGELGAIYRLAGRTAI